MFLSLATVSLVGCLVGDIFGDGGREALDENREKWRNAGVTSYTYREDRSCFCGFAGPADVTVIDGRISAVRRFVPDTADLGSDAFVHFDTVDDLFDVVADAIGQDAHQLDVVYDQVMGFPTRITIDYIEHAIDDEITITAASLTPILP